MFGLNTLREMMIDYSEPYLAAKKFLHDVHDAMLEQDYDGALSAAQGALVEVRMIHVAILDARDQQDALRKQTKALQERVPATEGTGGTPEPDGASASATQA
jgi:hypothetical protein